MNYLNNEAFFLDSTKDLFEIRMRGIYIFNCYKKMEDGIVYMPFEEKLE